MINIINILSYILAIYALISIVARFKPTLELDYLNNGIIKLFLIIFSHTNQKYHALMDCEKHVALRTLSRMIPKYGDVLRDQIGNSADEIVVAKLDINDNVDCAKVRKRIFMEIRDVYLMSTSVKKKNVKKIQLIINNLRKGLSNEKN